MEGRSSISIPGEIIIEEKTPRQDIPYLRGHGLFSTKRETTVMR